MAIRTDYEDLRIESDRTIELSFDVPRVAIIEAVVRDATADEPLGMLGMLERRMSIIEQERVDRAVLGALTARGKQEKMVEGAATCLRKMLNKSNIELAS